MLLRAFVPVFAGLFSLSLAACGGDDDDDGGGGNRDAAVNADAAQAVDAGAAPDAAVAGFCEPSATTELALELVADGLVRPLFAVAPVGDPRLFVLEQPGRILVIADGEVADTPFLDISLDRVLDRGNEQGLLGLAFHPGYASNGRFFVHYTGRAGQTVIAEYAVSDGDPNVADRDSERIILEVDQPQSNHNGGSIEFGPDGYLYIGLGDGGGANDDHGAQPPNGQNTDTLLATLLRIDVDGDQPYEVPADNPFVGGDGADEIYAFGLRNPYRFSFDRATGDIYIGDVGQDAREEISVYPADAPPGANFGWFIMEGSICRPGGGDCTPPPDHVPPVAEYPHEGRACFSVTGGYVYRGACLPSMQGRYFYADYCSPEVFSFVLSDGVATDERNFASLVPPTGGISSFGEDGFGELYITSFEGINGFGAVHRVVAAE